MGVFTENGIVREMACGTNFAYILNDYNHFLLTEYKVLQNQGHRGFIKCMKMTYNGDIELFYMTERYKPLSSLLPSIDSDRFIAIIANLLHEIIEVKSNGFLTYQNIDIAFDKIFIDTSNLTVGLIYVPCIVRAFKDFIDFENELRTNLVKLINQCPSVSSAKTIRLSEDLSNGMLTLEDIANGIKGINPPSRKDHTQPSHSVTLVALNAPGSFELHVNKDEFVIGKNAASVDGVIAFNNAISRIHCKIHKKNEHYYIEDMGSANGTYLNKRLLNPQKTSEISHGDIIRLANSDFQVRII